MSDHIGEPNEMSDTPRTNKEVFFPHDSKYQVCDADFARTLERELNAANVEIQRLRKSNLQLREGAEEQKQRIKRLEESENRMLNWLTEDCPEAVKKQLSNAWMKSKEAKP